MKLYKYEILPLIEYLDTLELKGHSSRMRTKLQKHLAKDHLELMEHVEQVKTDFKDDQTQVEYEAQLLAMETIAINEDEEKRDMLLSVKHSILNDPHTHRGEEAKFYDRFCELFERIQENN